MSKIHISNSTIKFMRKEAQGYPQRYESFWKNLPEGFPLGHSDFIKGNGGYLSKKGYESLMENAKEKTLKVSTTSEMGTAMRLMGEIRKLEKGHEKDLLKLAKEVVSKKFGIEESELDASFMNGIGDSGEDKKHETEAVLTPELYKEVGKRSLLNALAQGAGLDALVNLHNEEPIKTKIEAISSKLIGLYNEFGSQVNQLFYMQSAVDIKNEANAEKPAGIGWSSVDNDSEAVQAKGTTFTVICQELIKGVVAKYTNSQFNNQSRAERGLEPLTEEDCKAIMNAADGLENEAYQIQIGTEMWRKFEESTKGVINNVEGKPCTVDIISYLGAGGISESEKVIGQMISDPEDGKELLAQLSNEIEESGFGMEEYTEEDSEELGEAPLNIPEEELGESPDDWASIQESLSGKPKETPLINMPEEEKGLSPDDWASIQESLFGKPKKKHNPLIDQGLPPVKFDDDDDYK
jgi:hypothetical protein